MKTCTACKQAKPFEEFYRHTASPDNLHYECKTCFKTRALDIYRRNPERGIANAKRWQKLNPEKANARTKRWAEKNPEKRATITREWTKANPDKDRAKKQRWIKSNPGRMQALWAKRRAAKLQATPSWLTQADHAEIDGQYHFSEIMSKITGKPHEADHVIPLQGKTACGLHVPTNLQTLTRPANRRKSNSFNQEFSKPENPSLNELIQEAERLAS